MGGIEGSGLELGGTGRGDRAGSGEAQAGVSGRGYRGIEGSGPQSGGGAQAEGSVQDVRTGELWESRSGA